MAKDQKTDELSSGDFGTWSHPEGDQPTQVSRRTFLTRMRDALGSWMLLSSVPNWVSRGFENIAQSVDAGGTGRESEPTEPERSNKVIIDLTFLDTRQVLHQILGTEDRSKEIGVGTKGYEVTQSDNYTSSDPAVVKTALLAQMLNSRVGHGERMLQVSASQEEELGYQPRNPEVIPLESAVTFQLLFDQAQNPIGQLHVSRSMLERLLRESVSQHPEQKIISMSFQVGLAQQQYLIRDVHQPLVNNFIINNAQGETTQDLYYIDDADGFMKFDDSPYPELALPYRVVNGKEEMVQLLTEDQLPAAIAAAEQEIEDSLQLGVSNSNTDARTVPRLKSIEAYGERFAKQNLQQLVELCRRFPDKLFICAGGNENNNFYRVRQELMAEYFEQGQKWPDNLLLIGALNGSGGDERTEADGCDLYLRASDHDYDYLFSSDATAIVSTIADLILKNYPNFSVQALRRILTSSQFSRSIEIPLLPTEAQSDIEMVTSLRLDPKLVEDHLQVVG